MARHVVSAILFSPRGGSAYAARALARGLRADGWAVTLVAGSRSDLGPDGDARSFYGDVHAVQFDSALSSDRPLSFAGPPGSAPLHPSYEDRPDAPDRVFAKLDDLEYERQVQAWSGELERAGAAQADVLHLHHLTPLNEAAGRIAPGVPIVAQLHGSELLMLERIADGPPADWAHAERWVARLRDWAQRAARVVVAPSGVSRALRLLELPRDRVVPLPGGVDTELFAPREVDRRELWHRVLVEQPRGWLPDQSPGSLRYDASAVERLSRGATLLYVGRFVAVKRLDLLIAAFARAQQPGAALGSQEPGPGSGAQQLGAGVGSQQPEAGLVLVGGHPGEWEQEHPADIAARIGAGNVFLAGWYQQEELPDLFAAADGVALASDREQFGQVLVEGMACGLPAVATRSLGPEMIVRDGCTGWLTEPGDEEALAAAIREVVERPDERARRGAAARADVSARFSWTRISAQLAGVLQEAIDPATPTRPINPVPSDT